MSADFDMATAQARHDDERDQDQAAIEGEQDTTRGVRWAVCMCTDRYHDAIEQYEAVANRDDAARDLIYHPAGMAHLLEIVTVTTLSEVAA